MKASAVLTWQTLQLVYGPFKPDAMQTEGKQELHQLTCWGRVQLHHALPDGNTVLGPLSAPVWKL